MGQTFYPGGGAHITVEQMWLNWPVVFTFNTAQPRRESGEVVLFLLIKYLVRSSKLLWNYFTAALCYTEMWRSNQLNWLWLIGPVISDGS